MIRIAVLGAGRIGRIHGRNAAEHPGSRVVAVADPHAPSAESLAGSTGARVMPIEEIVESADVDAILLDNMSTDELVSAVALVQGRARLEASGGITLDNVRAIAETGIDEISIGALTHSARSLDVSLELT